MIFRLIIYILYSFINKNQNKIRLKFSYKKSLYIMKGNMKKNIYNWITLLYNRN